MPWLDAVDAVVEAWYPGQADGTALADMLFDDVDPGRWLPVTFEESIDECQISDTEGYPDVDEVAAYDEGVFVGYRYFDRQGTELLFPFGHGLSYGTFWFVTPRSSKRASACDGFWCPLLLEKVHLKSFGTAFDISKILLNVCLRSVYHTGLTSVVV